MLREYRLYLVDFDVIEDGAEVRHGRLQFGIFNQTASPAQQLCLMVERPRELNPVPDAGGHLRLVRGAIRRPLHVCCERRRRVWDSNPHLERDSGLIQLDERGGVVDGAGFRQL